MQLYIYDTKVTFQGDKVIGQRNKMKSKPLDESAAFKPVPYREPPLSLRPLLLPSAPQTDAVLHALVLLIQEGVSMYYQSDTSLANPPCAPPSPSAKHFRNCSWL